jgi:acid phosphatase (class A)
VEETVRPILLATVSVLLSAGIAQAQNASATPHPVKTLKFLNPADVDPSRLLPPPPKDGTPEQQEQMAVVKKLIQTRTKERHDQALWDARHEDPTPFAAVIGPGFDLSKLPATAKLLADVQNDADIAAGMSKEYFKRKFPVTAEMPADYNEWSCDDTPRKPESRPLRSYPSGHATLGYSLGIVLSGLIPEKSQALLARSYSYGYSREVCGDHYHADVEAGHVLGTTVGVLLLHNKALKPEMEAARAELKAAGLAQ